MSFIYKYETSTLTPLVKPRNILNFATQNIFYGSTWNLLLCSIQGEPTLSLSWLNNAEGKVFFHLLLAQMITENSNLKNPVRSRPLFNVFSSFSHSCIRANQNLRPVLTQFSMKSQLLLLLHFFVVSSLRSNTL